MLGLGIGLSMGSMSASTGATRSLRTVALQFNNTNTVARINDSASWTLNDSDWTLGILTSISTNVGSTHHYLISSGAYGAASTFNFILYEADNGTKGFEFIVRDAVQGAAISMSGLKTDGFTDNAWRLWTIERVKATETLNVYVTPVGGTRTLYATASSTGMVAVNPVTNPAIGTRAPPSANTYLEGGVHSFFKMDSLLTEEQVNLAASGADLVTDLAVSPRIYYKFNTTTSPLADRGTSGLTATLTGTFALVPGPVFPA